MARSRKAWLMTAASVVLLVGCHTISEELAETPTEPEAVSTVTPLTIPVILPAAHSPTPTPTATPTPASPSPGPTPTPEATPPPTGGGGCGAPSQSPNYSCQRTGGAFLEDVTTAIKRLTVRRPGLFNLNDSICDICYRIKDHDAYTEAVVAEVQKMGYCAFYDGEELAMKLGNDFSEQYDISTSKGYVRTGEGSYRATCWPAWF